MLLWKRTLNLINKCPDFLFDEQDQLGYINTKIKYKETKYYNNKTKQNKTKIKKSRVETYAPIC